MTACSVTRSHLGQASSSLSRSCWSSNYWVCSYLRDRALVVHFLNIALSAMRVTCWTMLAVLRESLWLHHEWDASLLLRAIKGTFELVHVMYLIALTYCGLVSGHRPIAARYSLNCAIVPCLIGKVVEVLLYLPSLKLFLSWCSVFDGLIGVLPPNQWSRCCPGV